jgi:hypothetical protein
MVRVGFSTSEHFISRLIRKLTRSKASHTFFIFYDETLAETMVMDAHFGGYRTLPLHNFGGKIIADIELKQCGEEAVKAAAQWLGAGYDTKALIGGLKVVIGRWFKRKWKNPWNDARKLMCSEAVTKALIAANYPGADKLTPEDTTPQDLLDFLQAA